MLNEYRQVADRVLEAGRYDRQGIGKLDYNKSIPNGDGNGSFTSLIPGSDRTPTAKARFARPVQDPDSNAHETSASRSGSAHLRVKNSSDQAPAPSVTLKVPTKSSKGRRKAQISQSRGDGQTSELNSQRPLESDLSEEEQAQLDQRLAKLKGTREARKGQPRSDGKTSNPASQRLLLSEAPDEEMVQVDKSMTESFEHRHLAQVPPIPSPFLSESIYFSDNAKRGAEHMVPSAKASEASEALGAKNIRNKQAAPLVREKLPTSLDALPGNGTGAPSPSGEDTQGPSPVDYNLEIKAEFPNAMVIKLQKNATLRARKTVIGRTLARRASFKDLQDYLRLHLPAPFLTVTLLTRGYFEVLFEKEEGARAARKLAVVQWSS